MIRSLKIYTIVLAIIILLSLSTIYVNEVKYIEIYKAIAGIDINVKNIELYNVNDTPKIYVTISISNPSKLDIKIVDIGGHIRLNSIYLGEIRFIDTPQYIGRESFNVSIMGVYEASAETIGYIKRSYIKGELRWSVYGWASFEVHRQRLMVEYKGELIG